MQIERAKITHINCLKNHQKTKTLKFKKKRKYDKNLKNARYNQTIHF